MFFMLFGCLRLFPRIKLNASEFCQLWWQRSLLHFSFLPLLVSLISFLSSACADFVSFRLAQKAQHWIYALWSHSLQLLTFWEETFGISLISFFSHKVEFWRCWEGAVPISAASGWLEEVERQVEDWHWFLLWRGSGIMTTRSLKSSAPATTYVLNGHSCTAEWLFSGVLKSKKKRVL